METGKRGWAWAGVAAALLCAALRAAAAEALPSFAELEAAGARIGTVRVVAQDVFDTSDPQEDKALFRLANRLHKQTRPGLIERSLLFRSGEPLQRSTIEETERLLRGYRFLYDVQIRPVAVHDGVVDIEVVTRDTWSFDPGFHAGRSGGANSGGIKLREYNLLGLGIGVGVARSRDVDRSSTEFSLTNPRVFGSWAALELSTARNSDGHRDEASLVRPFYALDARWTAGITALDDERIDRLYRAGEQVGGYRHREQRLQLFGGWSRGRVDGDVQRWTVGIDLDDDAYGADPAFAAPAALPADRRWRGPFLRWDFIEDRYDRELNRNLVGEPEYFALGLQASVRVAQNLRGWGGSDSGLRLSAAVAQGFEPADRDTLTLSAAVAADRLPDGWRTRAGVAARYYRPQGPHRLFYAALAADAQRRGEPAEALLLGGDNGLRGYPLRYQSGDRRVLFTVEQRFYTDLYVWRLFRVGGAVFADLGRAWGGADPNTADPGWLGDVGIGLRIVNARTAFTNVLHVDLAAPVGAQGDIRRWQLLVKSKATF